MEFFTESPLYSSKPLHDASGTVKRDLQCELEIMSHPHGLSATGMTHQSDRYSQGIVRMTTRLAA